MTTGSYTRAFVTHVGPSVYPVTFHRRERKDWSGSDQSAYYVPTSDQQSKRERWIPGRTDRKGNVIFEGYWQTVYDRLHRPSRVTAYDEHPYHAEGFWHNEDYGTISLDNGSTEHYFTASRGSLPGLVDPWTANDDIALFSKLREMISGTSFNAGVSAAEGHKTLVMIADSAKRIGRSLLQAKNGNFIGAARTLTEGTNIRRPKGATRFADNYMELQYGWKPLLKDIHDGAGFIGYQSGAPKVQRVKVSRRAGGFHGGHNYGLAGHIVYCGDCSELVSPVSIDSVKTIIAHVSEVNVPALAGLQDPMSIAWEVLPLSFVADWVYPVQSYLSARQLPQAITAKYVVSKLFRYRTVGEPYMRKYTVGTERYSLFRDPKAFKMQAFLMDRTITMNPTVPVPEFKPLGAGDPWTRCLTSVSLLVQRASKIAGTFSG